jgi:hypothetical protein
LVKYVKGSDNPYNSEAIKAIIQRKHKTGCSGCGCLTAILAMLAVAVLQFS